MAKAAEEEMQDTMLYDGDQQRYLRLLANGGEEEVGIDASDVDSSDVASSNGINSDSEDDSDVGAAGGRDNLKSSVARSAGRGKRSRAQMGAGGGKGMSDPNPLLAEIASKSERRQAASQRWFSDPIFDEVDETLAAAVEPVEDDVEMDDAPDAVDNEEASNKPCRGGGVDKGRQRRGGEEQGAAEVLLAAMPKTEKEKRKEKRKKVKKHEVKWQVGGIEACDPDLSLTVEG